MIITPLLEWILGKVAAWVSKWNAMRERRKAIEEKNQKILESTEKAQTKEERNEAAEEVLKDI